MTNAWFEPEAARLFSFLSLLSLCSLFSIAAKRGRLRGLTMAVWTAVLVLGVGLFAMGILARAAGQPPHVVRALLTSGVVVGVAFGVTRSVLSRAYQDAELRRTVAADL